MIIDAKYYCSVLRSFCDVPDDTVAFGTDSWTIKNAAKAISCGNDSLVLYGVVDEPATTAFFNGQELSVAYDSDMEAFFYIIKHNIVYKLEEKNGGGFYLDEQKLTNPLRLA